MAVLLPVRSRFVPALRWLAPSAVCACVGALVAGLLEGAGMGDPLAAAATAGFLAIVAVPALVAASVLGRGIYAAWRPAELGTAMAEDGGAAPRLAAWVAVVWFGALALAWATFQGTWLLAAWTAFKPITIGFAAPVIVVAAALIAVALSRPAADLFTRGARAFDARWRRNGRRTLLRPRVIFGGALALAGITTYVLWRFVVRPKLGTLDLGVLHAPAAAVSATVLAHLGWNQLRRGRAIAGTIITVLTAAAVAIALVAVRVRPALTLEIWGDQPLAGVAIERIFDLDRIRADVSLAEFRPVARPGAAHPDIILVTIDTVRADRTPPYGGSADMPVLKELGERGTVFVWAFAPSNVTRRSIPSMITGLQPNRVRGRVVGWALRIDPRHVLLAERLRAGGYETAGFMCCKGFWGEAARTGLERGLEHVVIEHNGMRLAKAARAWLDARERRPSGRPLFLWMHILEPHNWMSGASQPRNDDHRRRMYDTSLNGTDAMLLELFGAFTARSAERAPIAIVTADHGEGLGDHGAPFHSTDLYNSQIRVPLVIAGPGIKSQRVAETTSVTDLMPTIVELAGFQPPRGPHIDGRSLADLATGARAGSPHAGVAYAAMIKDRSNPGGVTAIIKGGWKLIDNGVSLELYDLRNDPDEAKNLVAQKPALVTELEALLAERHARGDPF